MAIYYNSKPVDVDTTYDPTSENAVSGIAVKEAIDEAVQSMYKPGGSVLFDNLPTLSADVLGFVYNVTDAFTTDARFVEGAGTEYAAGTNVVVVNTGTSQNPVYKFDILAAGAVQVQSDWAQSDTNAVDYIKNKPTIQTITAGTGIDITNDTISVASPTLTNLSGAWHSINIEGDTSSPYNQGQRSISIGNQSQCLDLNGAGQNVAVGRGSRAGYRGVAIGDSAWAPANYSVAIGKAADINANANSAIAIGANAYISGASSNAMQFGNGTNNEANTVKFGNGTYNYKLLDLTTGLIPADRLPSTVPSIDNTTITENNSNELQASAVINARTGTDVLPIWQGTEQQWTNGVGIDWYNWKSDFNWSQSSGMPSSSQWWSVSYGNGKFITCEGIYNTKTNTAAYSTDGSSWTSFTMPFQDCWSGIAYGGGNWVAVAGINPRNITSDKAVYSTDNGTTWTEATMPSSQAWRSLAYGNGTFVAVAFVFQANGGTNVAAYSTDGGATWSSTTLPSSQQWTGVTYGDGKFVAIASGYNKVAYSTDGINWNESTISSLAYSWQAITYGNGKFVAVATESQGCAYSTDGTSWTEASLPSSQQWQSVAAGDGKFIAVVWGSNVCAISENGSSWSASTISSSRNWAGITFGDNKFVAVASGTNISTVGSQSSVYTLEAEPTTASTVYNAPNTASALTITSVGTGTITLSDSNTYTYTQSGDVVTYQTIGEAHPNWLCNINGVGVKVGNTLVADKADFSEYLKKHQIDINGNYTSEFEYTPADSEDPRTSITVCYKNNGNEYYGSLRASNEGVSLTGQGSSGAYITQRGQYFVTETPPKAAYTDYTAGLIMTKKYLINNYPDNSSLVYNNNNYSLEVKGVKNTEGTDSSTTLKIWEGNSTEYAEDQQSKNYYCWREISGGFNLDFYTSTVTPQVGDMAAYKSPNGDEYEITATDGSTYIELFDGEDHADRYATGDTTLPALVDANTLCFVEGVGVKRNNVDIATKITLDNVPTQGSTNGITSGAVYTALGTIEATLDAIIAQGSNS